MVHKMTKRYSFLGFTDEGIRCNGCGQNGLKRHAILKDGLTNMPRHYGMGCATKLLDDSDIKKMMLAAGSGYLEESKLCVKAPHESQPSIKIPEYLQEIAWKMRN